MGKRWIKKEGRYEKAAIDENTVFILRNYNFHGAEELRLIIDILPEMYHPAGHANMIVPEVEVSIRNKMFDYTTTLHEIAHWYYYHALSGWEQIFSDVAIIQNVYAGNWLQQYRQMDKVTRFYSVWQTFYNRGADQMYANSFETERMEDIGMEDFYPIRQNDFYKPVFLYHMGKFISPKD